MLPVLCLSVAVAIAQSDSGIRLPAPSGAYAIGTVTARWHDSARIDSSRAPAGPRQISAQIWYPADRNARNSPAVYAAGVDTAEGEYGHLMARVRSNAIASAPFAASAGRAPVIVLSTGRSMAAYDYSSLAEELASHGFVVVGVNSPGLSRFILPEGGVISPAPAPPLRVLQQFDSADVFFEPMIQLVAGDLRFVVRQLALANRRDPIFAGRLDLDRLGMMGHSNGAIAGSRACAEERRCRAFLGIEGTQAREIRKHGVEKPYGLLISDQSLGFDTENVYRELGSRGPGRYSVIVVKGAGHNSPTDLLLIRPTLFNYPIMAQRGVQIARDVVRHFFERLRGDASGGGLRTALSAYGEVTVETVFPAAPRAP